MHQYRVTFLPLGPDGSTTERTIAAASWSPGDEWIDFRVEDGAVTHRLASGCVLSVEVLPETATGEEVLAAAREHIPYEPYPLGEPLADRDVIYHACGATCQTGGCHTAKAATPSVQFAPAMFGERKPQPGDHVHFVSEDGACLPARVFDIGTVEINEHDPAGDGRYREALSLIVRPDRGSIPVGRVLHEPGTYSGGARYAQLCEPMPLITCADLTFPPGTWHWLA